VASINLRDIAAWAGWTVPGLPMPFGGAVVDNGLGVLLALAVAAWLLRPGHSLVRAVGLAGTGWQGPAVVLHVSLNMAWNVMQVSETTAIGWQGNSLRLSAALLAVLGLVALRRWRRRTECRHR